MGYQPMQQHYNTSFNRLGSLVTITQLPHVQLNINCDSDATIEIPYIGLQSHYNLLNGEGAWGQLFVAVYQGFQTGSSGSAEVDCSLWLSINDAELVTPSVPVITAQSGPSSSNKKLTRKTTRKGGMSVADQEVQDQSQGIISSVMTNVSALSSTLARIPLLSSFAAPTAWATSIAANIASSYGWSKPLNQVMIARMNRTVNPMYNNFDGADNAFSMGLSKENKVRVLPGFGGTDVDEMSLDFLTQNSVYINTFNYATTNLDQDKLMNFELRPSAMSVNYPNGFCGSPVWFLSLFFEGYRGGFICKLKFAKTEFHSGRLQVLFSPGYGSRGAGQIVPPIYAANNQQPYLHREIIDIRHGNEFEFYFPYVSFQPYLPVGQAFGSMQVVVQNQLKAPATVSQQIQCVCEWRAAPDFELFFPREPIVAPTTANIYSQCDRGSDRKIMRRKVVAQADHEESRSDCQVTVNKPVGNSDQNGNTDTNYAQFCVGEQVKSVKQIMLRGSWVNTPDTGGYVIRPFAIGSLPLVARNFRNFEPLDHYSFLASMYAFSRGGVVIRAMNITPNTLVQFQLSLDNTNKQCPYATKQPNASTIIDKSVDGFVSAYIPQYHYTHGRLNGVDQPASSANQYGITGAQAPYFSPAVLSRWTPDQDTVPPPKTYWMRSAADDTQFGFFLGVPPCQVNPTSLPNNN